MIPFNEVIEKLTSIEKDFDSIVINATKLHKNLIIKMNVDDQLYQGLKANSQPIKPDYAGATKIYKQRNSQPYDRVTLKDHGDFYKSFDVEYKKDELLIKADDPKRVYLERKYTKDIYGLTKDSATELGNTILKDVIKYIKERL